MVTVQTAKDGFWELSEIMQLGCHRAFYHPFKYGLFLVCCSVEVCISQGLI